MVDLARTEEQMLAEIGWAASSTAEWTSTTSGNGSAPDGPWRLTGRTPDELLGILRKAFSSRYAHLPKAHVSADLIYLVKKGLGNAYKWGNTRDSQKLLRVSTIVTDIGAVIKISDQGDGFDPGHVVEQFARHERYFSHAGSGFSHFHNTTSVISYADGGRTLLIRFLCDAEAGRVISENNGNGANGKGLKKRWIDLTHLRLHDHVKVKGAVRSDGSFTALKVSLKPVEELAVIQAQLRHVENNGHRVIRILHATLTLSDNTQIVDLEPVHLDFGALRAGQIVEVTGRYSLAEGFSPVKLQLRNGSSPDHAVLKGRIEAINRADGTFRVLGVTVTTDDQTELFDKR
jgi:hypothetical protein